MDDISTCLMIPLENKLLLWQEFIIYLLLNQKNIVLLNKVSSFKV